MRLRGGTPAGPGARHGLVVALAPRFSASDDAEAEGPADPDAAGSSATPGSGGSGGSEDATAEASAATAEAPADTADAPAETAAPAAEDTALAAPPRSPCSFSTPMRPVDTATAARPDATRSRRIAPLPLRLRRRSWPQEDIVRPPRSLPAAASPRRMRVLFGRLSCAALSAYVGARGRGSGGVPEVASMRSSEALARSGAYLARVRAKSTRVARPSGSLSRQRSTVRSSSMGMPSRRVDGSTGSSEAIIAHTWGRLSPRNAGLPVSASYSTAPRDQTSAR